MTLSKNKIPAPVTAFAKNMPCQNIQRFTGGYLKKLLIIALNGKIFVLPTNAKPYQVQQFYGTAS